VQHAADETFSNAVVETFSNAVVETFSNTVVELLAVDAAASNCQCLTFKSVFHLYH